MTNADTRKIVVSELAKIAPEANFDALGSGENLRESLDIDSFDFLNFVIAVHKATGVDIPESDYGKLTTLDGIVRYVEERRG